MDLQNRISEFMAGDLFAVAGASVNRSKYGNMVLRLYQQLGHDVIPVNPNTRTVEGLKAVASLRDIQPSPHAVSIITPPAVTEQVVEDMIAVGIQHAWMQPGAESDAAIARCEEAGINLIHSGPCILVVLGYHGG